MAREDPQLKLRLSEEMKERISNAARENNRSVNAEIVARLQLTLDADTLPKDRESLLSEAIRSIDEATKNTKYYTSVIDWMREQQSLTVNLLEAIARTDGNLSPEFMEALKLVIATKGQNVDFPKPPSNE